MKLKQVIVFANIVVALLIGGALAVTTTQDRNRVIARAQGDAANLAGALAEHTRQTFFALDLAIGGLPEVAFGDGGIDKAAMHHFLAERQALSPGTFGFYAIDAAGKLAASSLRRDPEPVDLRDYPEYIAHRHAPEAGLYISPPRKGAIGEARGNWIVTLSRPLEGPGDGFAGVVVAALSLNYLLDFYDALRLGDKGTVALFNGDGILVARSPLSEGYLGASYADSALIRDKGPRLQSGQLRTTSPVDGVARLYSFHRVDGVDALVLVGLDETSVLAGWRQRLIFDGALAGLAFALFMLTSTAALAWVGQRQAWERERTRRLRILAEEGAALLKAGDVEAVLGHVAQTARTLIGAHQSVASLTVDRRHAQGINALSRSDRYARGPDWELASDDSDLQRVVCEANRPLRLTQAELAAHPAWRGCAAAGDRQPPMGGWLAAPLVAGDGGNLGLLQLADKTEGDFTEDDQNELTQLASIAAAAIEHLRATRAREDALLAAHAARAEVETIFTSISDAVYALDNDWRFTYLNAQAEQLLNRRREDLLGKSVWVAFPEARDTLLYTEYQRARAEYKPVAFEFFFPPLDAWFAVRAFPHNGGLTVYFQDVSRRIDTEERLRQAQKMDAIGQLTGGVAHDFNNILTVILGAGESLLDHLAQAPAAVRGQAEAVIKASERAASLIQRLLAFARKQPLDPRPTAINSMLGEVEDILRRLLGENIHIELVRGSGLWKATVDPGELQNAILNLAINARDAMPEGGKLTIETANMAVDADYAESHAISPGQYVMVAVSDTGTGMSPEVVARAFDPFFTTKEVGKGSGLGLSMVYGFARQSGGHAKIYSEPGEGTTVKIYLPRDYGGQEVAHPGEARNAPHQGSESILVVEDDELVRVHTVNCLQSLGYSVSAREDGPGALALLDQGDVHFDLLLTDVVLPAGMSGRRVAEEVVARLPGIRVLYMSGYTENAIVHHGRLDPGVHLLGKPFRLTDLARKVREVLDDG